MIVELGHFALVLAFAVALVQMIIPMVGAQTRNPRLMALADPAAIAQFLLIGFSFAALTYAFVVSDFSLRLVVLNSHTDKPMLYKFAGVWGNHEGSLLLWVLALSGELFWRQPARHAESAGFVGARGDWRGVSGLHAVHLEPVFAP